ncbi:MAG: NAD-dependent epimerase/dehydratase family protein, partial [Chloroflexi bacterium]|nr:NAD-dependent epimerase/dehydratase family protein [Chloroflexota bacterium]
MSTSKGKVLLTGHSGYIGSVMGPRLMAEGYQVVGLDTGYYGEECTFGADEPFRRRTLTGAGAGIQALWLTATALGAGLQFQTSVI